MTQHQKIINYIEKHGSITPMDAFPLGITKLSTRVSEMRRKKGMEFKIEIIQGKNQDGESMRYARYSFPENDSEEKVS